LKTENFNSETVLLHKISPELRLTNTQSRDGAKTRHICVETKSQDRDTKICLKRCSQDTCLQYYWLE